MRCKVDLPDFELSWTSNLFYHLS